MCIRDRKNVINYLESHQSLQKETLPPKIYHTRSSRNKANIRCHSLRQVLRANNLHCLTWVISDCQFSTLEKTLKQKEKDSTIRTEWNYNSQNVDFEWRTVEKGKTHVRVLAKFPVNSQRTLVTLDGGFSALARQLRLSSESIVSFTLNSRKKLSGSSYCHVTEDGLLKLMEGIAYLTNLSQLSLYFYSMHEVTDSGLAHILRIIPSLPHLKSLSLGLVGCVKVTDETLDAICTALQVKADLHGLALLLNGTGVTNGGILRLSRFLPYLPNVKEFTIDVEMVSEGSCVELANNIQNLTSLKTLRLRLSSSKEIGDLTLKSISVALQSHRNLSNVDLDFSNTGVNDEGVVAIGNQLLSIDIFQSLLGKDSCLRRWSDEYHSWTSITSATHSRSP
eukprot:TRINITY_DN6916_c0_g1_i3.p1 TRINITY_DN6916_c0_g1~~TRINITY_DN6916_c0_g1_i3.p1  ORF type:complete len:403 (+),score=29.82 TRINITY_DN6916_c0_g1_i3:32-1210(+)